MKLCNALPWQRWVLLLFFHRQHPPYLPMIYANAVPGKFLAPPLFFFFPGACLFLMAM